MWAGNQKDIDYQIPKNTRTLSEVLQKTTFGKEALTWRSTSDRVLVFSDLRGSFCIHVQEDLNTSAEHLCYAAASALAPD